MSHNVVVLNEVILEMGRAAGQGPEEESLDTVSAMMAHYLCGIIGVNPSEDPDSYRKMETISSLVIGIGAGLVSESEQLGGTDTCPICEEYRCSVPFIHFDGPGSVSQFRGNRKLIESFVTRLRSIF